jgi:hypothetical protein
MTNFKEQLIKLENYLSAEHFPLIKSMEQGKETAFIEKLLDQNGIKNAALIELYGWKNGVKNFSTASIESLELFPEGIMLSLEQALDVYKIYAIQQQNWSVGLFPIFTNGGGDYFLFDSKNKTEGSILLYAPSLLLSVVPQTIYDSLEKLFKTVLICFEKGAYKVSVDGTMEVDYDLRNQISKECNPKSEYWE